MTESGVSGSFGSVGLFFWEFGDAEEDDEAEEDVGDEEYSCCDGVELRSVFSASDFFLSFSWPVASCEVANRVEEDDEIKIGFVFRLFCVEIKLVLDDDAND